ncbi:MAG: hypothetical protein D6759_02440 [Chloroflexi bacterium]|nr:MAG: hypothetical protein D6759_02440 [Chloroflexota bacterium]
MNDFATIIPWRELVEFCRRWKIRQMALFGSSLRDDFGPESDIDVLIEFEDDADWSLLDHAQMQQELQSLVGRKIDLITKRALEYSPNWLRRQEILRTARVIFPGETLA